MTSHLSPLHILPPRGLRSRPTRGSRKDGHPNIRIAFPQRDFEILSSHAFARGLPLSTYIRKLIKRGQSISESKLP